MTREEAEEYAKVMSYREAVHNALRAKCVPYRKATFIKLHKLLDMVEPKTGHWVEENVNGGGRRVFCSECGCPPPFEYISTGDVYSASGYGVINKTKFCPNCGADMRED